MSAQTREEKLMLRALALRSAVRGKPGHDELLQVTGHANAYCASEHVGPTSEQRAWVASSVMTLFDALDDLNRAYAKINRALTTIETTLNPEENETDTPSQEGQG